jgi:hypothetical protein
MIDFDLVRPDISIANNRPNSLPIRLIMVLDMVISLKIAASSGGRARQRSAAAPTGSTSSHQKERENGGYLVT